MPLPKEHPCPVEWFQTKDVPTDQLYLERWVIRADGRLVKHGVRYEDRSDKSLPKDDFRRFAGMMTPVPVPEDDRVIEDFHGDLCFGHYDDKTGEDWDYIARFTDGVCTRISLEHTPPKQKDAALA